MLNQWDALINAVGFGYTNLYVAAGSYVPGTSRVENGYPIVAYPTLATCDVVRGGGLAMYCQIKVDNTVSFCLGDPLSSGMPGEFSWQGLMAHEIGHFLGVPASHYNTSMCDCTEYPGWDEAYIDEQYPTMSSEVLGSYCRMAGLGFGYYYAQTLAPLDRVWLVDNYQGWVLVDIVVDMVKLCDKRLIVSYKCDGRATRECPSIAAISVGDAGRYNVMPAVSAECGSTSMLCVEIPLSNDVRQVIEESGSCVLWLQNENVGRGPFRVVPDYCRTRGEELAATVDGGRASIVLRRSGVFLASVAIYDVRGRKVRQLAANAEAVDAYECTWDCRDGRGRRVADGVYVVKAGLSEQIITERIAVLR